MSTPVHYTTRLVLGDIERDDRMEVVRPLDAVYGEYTLVVPAGVVVDGASIPRFFWRVIGPPMRGPWLRASILHDTGYTGELVVRYEGVRVEVDKPWCDRLFHDALIAEGVGARKAWIMWQGVCRFGRGRWG